jgi:phosphoribosylamine--glycine ligase
MRILLVTSSARGHALADALYRSPQKPELIAVSPSRNPGIRRLAKEQHVMDIMDFPKLIDLAKKSTIDFAVIGPDDPIGGGLADELEKVDIPSVAPKKALARLESSKGFTRDLMKKYNIDASPQFFVLTRHESGPSGRGNEDEIRTILTDLEGNYVVKYDGLKGGKGVKVSDEHLATIEEGVSYALECIEDGGRVVIEEKLIGIEFSRLAFVSGSTVIPMPAVQDHKRAFEGDTGPNTGGMGTYSDANHSLPFLTDDDLKQADAINQQIANAVMKECGEPYKGILYGGFMATKNGVKVIEYNARFGDPEALNILPLLKSVLPCQNKFRRTHSRSPTQYCAQYKTPQPVHKSPAAPLARWDWWDSSAPSSWHASHPPHQFSKSPANTCQAAPAWPWAHHPPTRFREYAQGKPVLL